jgi:hypothetical protein
VPVLFPPLHRLHADTQRLGQVDLPHPRLDPPLPGPFPERPGMLLVPRWNRRPLSSQGDMPKRQRTASAWPTSWDPER